MTAKRTGLLFILLASAACILTIVIFVTIVAIRMKPRDAIANNDEYWHTSAAGLGTRSSERLNWRFAIPELADSAVPLSAVAEPGSETAPIESETLISTNVNAAAAVGAREIPPLVSDTKQGSGTRSFATVDVERLVQSFSSDAAPKGEREAIVRRIRDAVTKFSKSRNIPLVFDRSGLSINQVPVILNADGVADITDQILRELTQSAEN